MAFDYFYGAQSQQFAFYRIPKVLFTDNRFQKISTEGKVLYGLLLDRVSLSMENGWIDDEGRVYIIFTLTTIRQAMNCAEKSAIKYLTELEDIASKNKDIWYMIPPEDPNVAAIVYVVKLNHNSISRNISFIFFFPII